MPKKQIEPESCATCRFFQENHSDNYGWCRRYPPTPVAIEDATASIQASTSGEEWCGEFSRRLNA